ncbi:MAG: heparan-alpha-glucosaminide N-acetyltransferase domain-containing protein [Pseudomonadota bacterium]|nr:heparan-alpha-glucosaminide N-acetyltransferase domain-containing protein [Pseudomonadota bacterium]
MGKLSRLPAIDMLRGFVIVLMALDHVRDFFGVTQFNPEDLALTTPGWFWTRWITHLCATSFVLLAGSSAFLRGLGAGVPSLSRYLATRGALLLLLEASWISFSWQLAYNVMILQVLWALGAGMIALSLLVWLPRPLMALVAALLIVSHNALDSWHPAGALWQAWHAGGFYPIGQHFGVVFMYPLMPWLGLIAAGYALGPVFLWERQRRQRFLLAAAALLMLAFVALRAGNLYGDPDPWSPQGRGAMVDLMSFVRVHKYPPSLLYLCVTGSLALALLALFERVREVKLLTLFGRTPLFFYVIHIALAHLLGNLYFHLRFGGLPDFSGRDVSLPAGYQPSLVVVYAAWIGLIALMAGLTVLWQRWRHRAARVPSGAP